MNYLAHLHLGGPQPAQLLGSLYGDFVKGRLQGQWPGEIERAIQLHRRIDAFTDSHPLVHAAKRRFPLERRRFAGVLLDVFFDHCLARDWNDYADEPLPQFVERVYGTLRTASPLPERLARIAPRMAPRTGWAATASSRSCAKCWAACRGGCRDRTCWTVPGKNWPSATMT